MEFTQEQIQAICHKEGPALVLSIPGSGKTTMLMVRLHTLISSGVDPRRILTITFSRAAVEDMKKRYEQLYPNEPIPLFLTIHSLCFSIIREDDAKKNRKRTLISGKDSPIHPYDLYTSIHRKVFGVYPTDEDKESFFQELSFVKNRMKDPKNYESSPDCQIPKFYTLYQQYEKAKEKYGTIDFDDMILLANDILGREPYLKRKYRNYFDYIQIDEAQDTSPAQFSVIYQLINKKNNIFIVADDDQSIYGFRGADPEVLFEFQKRFEGCKSYYLQQNFRSSKNIVELSEKTITKNKHRFQKKIGTPNPYKKPVQLIRCRHTRDQYSFILEELKRNPELETAILFRNTVSALGILLSLEQEGIPFYVREGRGWFFKTWMLHDIVSFLSLAKYPGSIEALEKIYYKMKGYLSKKQISYAKNHPRNNVFDAMADLPGLPYFQKKGIYEIKGDFNHLGHCNPKESLEFILDHLKYREYLENFCKRTGKPLEPQLVQYQNFIELSKTVDTTEEFFGRLDYLEAYISEVSSSSGITLSTIHGAKGLEFDRVFIIDLCDKVLPSSKSIKRYQGGDATLLEEERRLFYVAITRGRSEVFLLSPSYILKTPREISRFLDDLE
ncbi:MAG: ATP-dependent helicase [Tissierellia bacterium]|nr:ATP-dependent helicase [Tissierellia bacterium]